MAPEPAILVVDDDAPFRGLARQALADRHWQIHEAADGTRALEVIEEHSIGVVLLDLGLPDMDGLTVLQRIVETGEPVEVVVVTGRGSIDTAVQALRLGAFHYLTKPVDITDLQTVVDKAVDKQRASFENRLLREAIQRGGMPEMGQQVVAVSRAMRELFQEARAAAAMESPILIEGETGVGKEVVATYIHRLGNWARAPFNVINCAAIPEGLLDSEFFGHAKGAFTGADQARPGIIEVSHGGSLLLDEIGDISPAAQVRLLRVLEYGLVRRVGSSKEIPVDVRIMASTHRDLEVRVADEDFREDLFHRLVVIRLRVPPLRERREDIVPLAEFFLDQLCIKYGDQLKLHENTHGLLLDYRWLGNVRELRNVIERGWFAAHRDDRNAILGSHLHFLREGTASDRIVRARHSRAENPGDPCTLTLAEVEARHIQRVLEACTQNRREAAKILGISERSLYRKLKPDL